MILHDRENHDGNYHSSVSIKDTSSIHLIACSKPDQPIVSKNRSYSN